MCTNFVGEFIGAGRALEVAIKDRKALEHAYIDLAEDIAKDLVTTTLDDNLEDLLIIDEDGDTYLLDEFEIERHLVHGITQALLRMAGR